MGGGEVTAYSANKLLTLVCRAEKVPVFMISSSATAEVITVQSHNRHVPPVLEPAVVDLYNNMNGVDVADQLGVYYSFPRKLLKWWRKVFFGC